MKKRKELRTFLVAYTEKIYYLTTEVVARDKDEASDKFWDKWNNGDVPVANSEQISITIREEKV